MHVSRAKKNRETPGLLRGWKQIAEYLSQPTSTAQRWAKQGMPVHRERRNVVADPVELNAWLGKESGAPSAVTIANSGEDLVSDLRRGLSAVRRQHRRHRP